MCQERGCPVHTPIPEVIRLFKERRMDEAGALLFENNPMSAVCSLVCNHSNQCEGNCVQARRGNPVHFSSIEHYISSTYLDRLEPERPEPCGKVFPQALRPVTDSDSILNSVLSGCGFPASERPYC